MTAERFDGVVVVGGGLAGIAASLRLARSGVRVLLLETRARLGGRATSHIDPETGEPLDNCQHVVLRCCTAYMALLSELGVDSLFEWHDRQYWVEAGGRVSVIRPGFLPAPAHYTASFLRASFLSAGEKLAIGRCLLALRGMDPRAAAGRTFADVLRELRQPAGAIRKFWSPIIVGACNLDVDRVSARPALKVILDGFLSSRDAAVMGLATTPLLRLYDAVPELLARAGGDVRTGVSVRRIEDRTVHLESGRIDCEAIVCALPPERVAGTVDHRLLGPETLAGLNSLEYSPILGVHLRFDRPVLDLPHCVLVGRPTHWFFRKDAAGTRIHAVISAADGVAGLSRQAMIETVVGDLRACFPGTAKCNLLRGFPIVERRATFAATPAAEDWRPAGFTESSRLLLAGDYLQTGWPATMEGAVRSGVAAAENLVSSVSPARSRRGGNPEPARAASL